MGFEGEAPAESLIFWRPEDLDAQAEGADPDNDDASYRIASVTAWGKAVPEPAPAAPATP